MITICLLNNAMCMFFEITLKVALVNATSCQKLAKFMLKKKHAHRVI